MLEMRSSVDDVSVGQGGNFIRLSSWVLTFRCFLVAATCPKSLFSFLLRVLSSCVWFVKCFLPAWSKLHVNAGRKLGVIRIGGCGT